ncbi:MAG: phosphate ABC transporter permease PstA [Candidatus Methanomethyliaceae archaeon]|nr:phosphate ABC transporter permease PstA [Candidatus Methanomethyliaceae archaeon]
MNMRRTKDLLMKLTSTLITLIMAVPLLWIILDVIIKGASALSLDFIISLPAPFGEVGGGIGNAILGTLIINAMACVIGLPLGIATGIYLSEYSNGSKISALLRTAIDTLSGIPSIILGLFAFSLIVIRVGHYTALAAAFALSIIMIPVVSKATEEGMKTVSVDIREGAIALGLPKWVITIKIVLGIAKSSVITSSLLAFARISGETAPLLFTSLFSYYWPRGLNEPMASLQVLIYNYAMSGFESWVVKAWGASLLLMLLVLSINILVRRFSTKVG